MGEGPVSLGRRNEVVLIAGCSDGGIGAALALEFGGDGSTVVATSRSVSTMKVFEWHQHIEVLALDLLSEESFKEAVESVLASYYGDSSSRTSHGDKKEGQDCECRQYYYWSLRFF